MNKYLAVAMALWLGLPVAVRADEVELRQCAELNDSAARLTCYDNAIGRKPDRALAVSVEPVGAVDGQSHGGGHDADATAGARDYLDRVWNLDGKSRMDDVTRIGRLRPHRQSYFIARKSSRLNELPSSPAPGHQAITPLPLEFGEAKFQFSFKSEIADKTDLSWLGFDSVRIWAAYTQQSNWQAFNIHNSAAFRETNYEPELIVSLGNHRKTGLKMVNLGVSHQSNGQNLPLSRSWNRVYLQGGWEWDGKFSLLARGWWRLPENVATDDNPDIENFMGRGDLVAHWEPSSRQSVSLLLRNNLRSNGNRGFVQLDWATPFMLGKAGKAHVQLTSGYGESLVDYNFRQTTIGIGVSFRDW